MSILITFDLKLKKDIICILINCRLISRHHKKTGKAH